MIHNYMCEGYHRTACWSKVQYLHEGKPISKLRLFRSRHEKGISDAAHPWLKLNIYGTAVIMMDWDMIKHKVPYQVAMKDFIEIQRRNDFIFKDFVVERIEVGIDDSDLVDMVNRRIKERRNTFGGFPGDTRFYVLYKNVLAKTIPGINIDVIKQINDIAIKELGFKVEILVLREIHTYQGDEFSFNFVLQEKEIIDKIIGDHVNNEKWFQLPEVRRLPGKVFPGSRCTYEEGASKTWKVIRDEEIKPRML